MAEYCMDWACPSWVSCRHHFGRSEEYAAMTDSNDTRSKDFKRADGAQSCWQYERDEPKEWLKDWF